jgi:hypothetical protein
METPQTHCYAVGTVTLLWKCYKVHRSCYHGKPNMSQYLYQIVLCVFTHADNPFQTVIKQNSSNDNEN